MMRLLPQGLLMTICAAALTLCAGQLEDRVARGALDRIQGFQGGPVADLLAALESESVDDDDKSSLSRVAAPHRPDFAGSGLPPSCARPAASSSGQLLQSAPKTGPPTS